MRSLPATLALFLLAAPGLASAQAMPPATKAEAQAAIWAKEQAIYQARGRGDMKPYQDGIARDYLAWPPFRDHPAGAEGLRQIQKKMIIDNKEVLSMTFVDFVLNGDAAVIYYSTHRTRLPDGTAVDERFEVTHSWVWQDGAWKVMGGMARDTPKR